MDPQRLRRQRAEDATECTYLHPSEIPGGLRSHLTAPGLDGLAAHKATLAAIAARVSDHQFDLLGSGPIVVRHGATGQGLEGIAFPPGPTVAADGDGLWLLDRVPASAVEEARRIWRLVDPGYVPIDWQLDFRSGYRWSERKWSRDIRFGDVRGADVKLPWELARMQHLPQLALAAVALRTDDAALAERCAREFKNEILDFVATNPPRFGVNWITTMDVAIRVVNWLAAWDLFRVAGARFDASFDAVFRRSVLEHGRHIAAYLEWAPVGRGNHYLADIVGLLFAAAWLPPSADSNRWLSIAAPELINEARRQLQEDGSGFEASTCYHRLSAEIITWGTALLAALPDAPVVPAWLLERLGRAAEFTIDLTKSTGYVAQIGDNDSGRFLALLPSEPLDHRHIVAAIGGLLDREDLQLFGAAWAFEGDVVRALSGAAFHVDRPLDGRHRAEAIRIGRAPRAPSADSTRLEIPIGAGARVGLRPFAYRDFGVFILRSDRVFLAIRCGSVGQEGIGGHAHNDQLAIELSVDGRDWIRDPGTYVYTPLPERRNAYRSVRAHFVPILGDTEPARLDQGLFVLGDPAVGRCLAFGPDGFAGELRRGRSILRARMTLEDDRLVLEYEFDRADPDPRLASGDWQALLAAIAFSPGYGIVEGHA
jgi:hypothetical protein